MSLKILSKRNVLKLCLQEGQHVLQLGEKVTRKSSENSTGYKKYRNLRTGRI